MKTKKLVVLTLAMLMAAMTLIPSTFSWYSHSATASGNLMKYTKSSLPVSMKTAANSVSVSTKLADQNAVESGDALTSFSVAANSIQYYVTTLTNTGSNDVYLDLQLGTLPNSADVRVGTNSPVVNQKAYASRAARTKKSSNTVRVYFKTHSSMTDYWNQANCKAENKTLDTSNVGSSNTTTSDMNIAYSVDGDEQYYRLERCPNTDATTYGGTDRIFYYDVPSNAEYFYFFNHWYFKSASNREWNRTINISDLTAGKLYYLNGEKVDNKYKAYTARPVDDTLLAVMESYDTVRMSLGSNVTADISLKKESENEDDEFTPDYYGASITYSSGDTSKCTVNSDGLISPKASTGNTPVRITTTITGKFGDSVSLTTDVTIPTSVDQFPIAQNIKVPCQGTTDSNGAATNTVKVHWYIINNGSSAVTPGSVFVTI